MRRQFDSEQSRLNGNEVNVRTRHTQLYRDKFLPSKRMNEPYEGRMSPAFAQRTRYSLLTRAKETRSTTNALL
jgi:hypothetical protein